MLTVVNTVAEPLPVQEVLLSEDSVRDGGPENGAVTSKSAVSIHPLESDTVTE